MFGGTIELTLVHHPALVECAVNWVGALLRGHKRRAKRKPRLQILQRAERDWCISALSRHSSRTAARVWVTPMVATSPGRRTLAA